MTNSNYIVYYRYKTEEKPVKGVIQSKELDKLARGAGDRTQERNLGMTTE